MFHCYALTAQALAGWRQISGVLQAMRKWHVAALLILSGCSGKLESGYEPRKLDLSVAQRKALYAEPYSQQAAEAQQDNEDDEAHGHAPPGTPGSY
jgi:hypothetical protein